MGLFDELKSKASEAFEEAKAKVAEIDIEAIKTQGLESLNSLADEASKSISEFSDEASKQFAEIQEAGAQKFAEFSDDASKQLSEIQEVSSQKFAEISQESAAQFEALKTSGSELYDKASVVASDASQWVGETVSEGVEKISNVTLEDVGDTALRGAKLVSGVQAYNDRKESIELMDQANAIKSEVEAENEKRRQESNKILEDFGKTRLESLKTTVGVFLEYMKRINKNLKDKDYEINASLDIKPEEIKELETVEMNASEALKTTAAVGAVASAAVAGVPALVTAAVTAAATASTGTAISTLSGAAANAAVYAWLGGGSIAAGGGGMAAGAAVMTGITCATTGVFAIAAAGIIAGAHYSKKHTEATEYLAQMQEYKGKMELAWTAMEGVNKRAEELKNLTLELRGRIEKQLGLLAPYIDVFDKDNEEHMLLLQQTTLMVKSMSELSQISLLDDDGNLSEQSGLIKGKVEKVLNKNL